MRLNGRMNALLPFALLVLSTATLAAEDWPQWLGPRGDSTWNKKV